MKRGGAKAAGAVRKTAATKKGAAKGRRPARGAVLTRKVTLRSTRSATAQRELEHDEQPDSEEGESSGAEDEQHSEGDDERQQGPAGRQQQQQQVPAAAKRRRRGSAAASGSAPSVSGETITSLTAEALQEVFLHLSRNEQQSYCREILPLVCKRFRDVLHEPSAVWESLHIDFIQKGQDLALTGADADAEVAGDGSNRRVLHSAVERWVKPRAAAIKRLVLSFSARDMTHSFPKTGAGLRRMFRLLAPTLQELCIAHCSDIFHAKSFADVALLQNLEKLAVTFQVGRVSGADLAPLEQLRKLKALTLSANRQAEEGGEHCLAGFPETLLKLKGLTSLAICSLGVSNLPAGITKLKALAALDVSGCPLSFLPSQMWKLSALRHLRLNGTNLMVGLMHTWEPLGKLPALESVELRDTKVLSLPPALPGLSSLTSLDLSDNPFEALSGPPDSLQALAKLPKLQRLLLRCCQLPSAPADLCLLSQLTHLDLSRNQLVELPPTLSTLTALRELSAEGCCFPRIPQVLGELPSLEFVDLSFNIYMEAALSLKPLVQEGGLGSLRKLDLRKMLGVWKQSSTKWLAELLRELQARHVEEGGSLEGAPVVLWD